MHKFLTRKNYTTINMKINIEKKKRNSKTEWKIEAQKLYLHIFNISLLFKEILEQYFNFIIWIF